MGAGIAQVVAASGRRVSLHDPYPGAVERGLGGIERSLGKLAAKGGGDPAEVLARITAAAELVDADLMIEAITEDAAAKEDLFRRADGVLGPSAILASNTSSIPITSLAAVTERPERVIGMHFFNPVPVLKLVEVIRAVQTSDETAAAIVQLARDLGKEPAEARDFPGFISNRILMPFINEAAYALLEGVGDAEAIPAFECRRGATNAPGAADASRQPAGISGLGGTYLGPTAQAETSEWSLHDERARLHCPSPSGRAASMKTSSCWPTNSGTSSRSTR